MTEKQKDRDKIFPYLPQLFLIALWFAIIVVVAMLGYYSIIELIKSFF